MLKDSKEFKELLCTNLALGRFVPKEWVGIKGFPPLDLVVREDFPASHKMRARPINPRLFGHTEKEFKRLLTYLYRLSVSPWASGLVVAAKATEPFMRFCGDYRWFNGYCVLPQAYIPRIQYEIEKAMGFKIFLDIDMTNSFHQFPLTERTSQFLAVQTPWGLVEPLFLPEGVSPASGHLQSTMMQMFGDFTDWTIVIFDNILVLAHDEKDAIEKLRLFLERCEAHNVILKLKKSWFGSPSVKFFGYKVSFGKHQMDADCKKVIDEYAMPTTTKGMQSFLGAALFFKSHVANFSDQAANLHKMTQKSFNWDPKTWKEDYEGDFKKMKLALSNSIANHFPDYDLDWTLRVDASKVAVGAVLYQTRKRDDGTLVHEAIGFASKKFSEVALNWDPMKKESYACFFGIEHFAYYLRGKPFVLETDHRNILWIEKSDVPIIVRWRIFMQSFVVTIRHIAGLKNKVADWLSRLEQHYLEEANSHIDLLEEDIECLLLNSTKKILILPRRTTSKYTM